MATSQARIDANRRNAQHSCGPKTPEGKAISRRNGLKHGLTGAGIVLAEADAAEVELRAAGFEADLTPQTAFGKFLVRQMATLSVRMDRSTEHEGAAIAQRSRSAGEAFDQTRLDEADRLFDALGEQPRAYLRKLRQTPEGVERLMEGWAELRGDLAREIQPNWTARHLERALNLAGFRVDDLGGFDFRSWSQAIAGDFSAFGEGLNLPDHDRKALARTRLVERIDAEIAELEAHYETLDFEALALDRQEAPSRALFDTSPEAVLARRYESEASRRFFKSFKELRQVEAETKASPTISPPSISRPPVGNPYPPTPFVPLASSWERPIPVDRDPLPAPETSRPVSEGLGNEPIGGPESRIPAESSWA